MPPIKILSADHVRPHAQKIMTAASIAKNFDFILVMAGTAVSDREGVSAAGQDAQRRRLTPKLDAEALINGCTSGGDKLPTSPVGVTSPVVLTRAALALLKAKISLVDCGSFTPPQVPHESVSLIAAGDLALTQSLPESIAQKLYNAGQMAASRFDENDAFPVIAECVPGGTTTASAVLELLGTGASAMLSSSIADDPSRAKSLKAELIQSAILRLTAELSCRKDELVAICQAAPLKAVAFVGDPMQAYVAGFVVANARLGKKPLILAGGSQMLAVYALARAVLQTSGEAELLAQTTAVVTTKWVAFDPYAQTQALAAQIGAPYVAACLDLSASSHAGLRAYEDGHVKEGVGAGAALALALQRHDELVVLNAVDETYRLMTRAVSTRQRV